ncbi:MAG: DUF3857 domain-containing protein [Candidatus Zixiibacteriota bacterium]
MSRINHCLFTLVGCLLFFATCIQADEFEWKQITSADWNIVADSARKISNAAVIFDEVISDTKYIQDGDLFVIIYRRVRILSDEGRKWGDVEVPIFSTEQKIKEIKGRTIERGNKIHELTKDMIVEKKVIKSDGDEVKQTKFTMPAVTNDCIVEYMIKIETGMYSWILQEDVPVLSFQFRWLLPVYTVNYSSEQELIEKYLTPNYLFLNKTSEIDIQQLPNLKKPEEIVFKTKDVPPFEAEPYSLPDAALQTKMFSYLGARDNPMSYWGNRAENIIDNQEEFAKKNKRLKEVVESFGPLATDEEKIAKAYNWVQENITNLSYFDLKDPKNPKKEIDPKDRDNVNDVIKLGYGGRTDICRIFCDMLREMNIDAKMAYAGDRSDDIFVLDAKFWQFDNTLVAVKLGPDSYKFYAPGHAMIPLGSIPWFLEGITALIGDADIFANTPFSKDTENKSSFVYTYNIDDELAVEGEFSARLTGHHARSVKVDLLDEDSADYKHLILENIDGPFGDTKIEVTSFKNVDMRDEAVSVGCTIEQPDVSATGDKILLKPFSFVSNAKNPFISKERKTPMLFNYAFQRQETAQINFPAGWTVEALPHDTTYSNLVGSCTVTFEEFGEGISIQRLFILKAPFWGVDTYSYVKKLFEARENFSDLIAVIKIGEESE